ncbi:MAG: response regulator, partial [Patescibacteria group bacterium]|nr:response regulator [Patescibacteria group bacterium]
MCPERAKVIIVEDNPKKLEMLAEFLISKGHQIIGTAPDKKNGLALIEEIKEGNQPVDVCLFDAHLTERSNGEEGKELAEVAREKFPEVKIISISC